ncbi:MAG TPA: zinc-binding alcohol dehydrogenase family protein [Methylophilaceae bacterium]|jgi:zinc-binding alcohol dehydrogenase family protein
MKAVAYYTSQAITAEDALVDIELPTPQPLEHDLLIEIKAIAVNPVDTKVRRNSAPPTGNAKVLGWDATGVVVAVGSQVSLFKVGDEVWYAGDISRAGCNSQLQLVDERIVGLKPKSLDFATAAALPLTALTAYELLFDRLAIPPKAQSGAGLEQASLLVIGAAGGVGSILVQLAAQLTDLRVIGTASRAESIAWLKKLGAHDVINHHQPISQQLAALGCPEVDYIISLTNTDQHFDEIVKAIKPQGKFALIDDPELFDFRQLKRKSVSLHWELMFTRSLFKTADMIKQHETLNEIAHLVDKGLIQSTVNHHFGAINAHHLKQAHAMLESGTSIGKIVLEGFE